MFKGKKLILVVVLATLVIAGSIGGVVLAQNEAGTGKAASMDAMWNRVAEIYQEKTGTALDMQGLKDSITQAGSEQQIKNMEAKLNAMVSAGKITQNQADEMLNWWQSKPTDLPFDGRFGPGMFDRGGRMMRGFVGPCFPGAPPETSDSGS